MMRVKKETWGKIPLLHVAPEERFEEKLPTVVFFHGFTSAKEHNLHYAYQLAERGVRVILPDALLHGDRSEGLDEVQLSLRFWETVLTSIEELAYINELIQEKGLAEGQIGAGGTSMGGITTLGALVVYPWIRTAAVMMGAGNYVQFAQAQIRSFEKRGFQLPLTEAERQRMLATLERFDITKQQQALRGRPIFFWHGEQDTTVPFEPTFKFYNAIKEDYKEFPEKLHFIQHASAGHAVTREGMIASAEWLARHLTEQAQ